MAEKSLLIIGQPRGFTTPVYDLIVGATSLAPPCRQGEVLNYHLNPECVIGHRSQDVDTAAALLDRYQLDYVVKDVVNPFVVLEYLKTHEAYRVLHVYRDPEDCMRHQRARGWGPVDPGQLLDEFLRFPTVCFDDLIYDSDVLWDAVEALGYAVNRFDYAAEPGFQRKREQVLSLK